MFGEAVYALEPKLVVWPDSDGFAQENMLLRGKCPFHLMCVDRGEVERWKTPGRGY
jgi:hypothetical protein